MFKLFLNHPNLFPKDYQSQCSNGKNDINNGRSKHNQQQYDPSKVAQKPLVQHWGPPQHCRCGIHDCSISYTIYNIERIQSIQGALKRYLLSSEQAEVPGWFPSESIVSNSKKNSVSSTKRTLYNQFLQAVLSDEEILSTMNDVTKVEQDYFGYLPLTIQQVQNGTISLRSD